MSDNAKLFGMSAEKGRWIFVVLGFTINLCLGSVYAFSVFKPQIEIFYKVGGLQSNLPFMIFLAFFAITMFFGGKLIEKLGPRTVGIIGSVIVAAGWMLCYLTQGGNIMALVLTYGVIAGSGVGLAYGGPIAVAARWFPDKKGLAVGLTVAGFGGSAFITGKIAETLFVSRAVKNLSISGPIMQDGKVAWANFLNADIFGKLSGILGGLEAPLKKIFGETPELMTQVARDITVFQAQLANEKFGKLAYNTLKTFGLHDTFLIFGFAFLILLVLLSLPLKFPVAGWKPAGWTPPASAAAGQDFTRGEMVKTGTYWGLFLCFTFGSLAGLMAIGISSPVGQEIIEIAPATAASLVGLFAIFNALGRPIFGMITDKLTPKNATLLNLLIILVMSLLMLTADKGMIAMYVIAFIGFWMCLGGWLAIAPTTTATYFGMKNYANNYGVVFFAYGIGAIIGGIISGLAKDIFGSYKWAFAPTAALSVLGIILAIALIKPPKK
jgi:MFS family permease